MNKQSITIATRQSALALWQANAVKTALLQLNPELSINLLKLSTRGDEILDKSLEKIGGKGLFIKELEIALLDGRADLAVHSMKDVPATWPSGLTLAAICQREDARDVLVTKQDHNLAALARGAVIGTSSLRRQCQIKALRPDLNTKLLRGNVNSRLEKLDKGDYDAIILAAAGLKRLQLEHHIQQYFTLQQCIPAPGQGALGLECRDNDHELLALIKALDDASTRVCVLAERAVSQALGGNCQTPLAAHAQLFNQQLKLCAMVGYHDGRQMICEEICGPQQEAISLGQTLAQRLIKRGALTILKHYA